jgi:poly-gamma-glutamate capsule biosynthesis protein CapA/YwtB (metallophosphatase superfamily)
VAAEKAQDMAEVGVTMNAWEYRTKWYGEDEATARKLAAEIGASGTVGDKGSS